MACDQLAADAVVALAADPLRRAALGHAGRAFVTQQFNCDVLAKKMLDVLQDAASSARRKWEVGNDSPRGLGGDAALSRARPRVGMVRLVHTGQHYDANMSDAFFRDLGLPEPDLDLGIGSGSHAEQTAGVMIAYEKACMAARPDWTVVVGDVNSTLACTLAASKLGIRVAHLEAGLRSRDRSMPEELNRLATDALADLLWTPSPDADENLAREGSHPGALRAWETS